MNDIIAVRNITEKEEKKTLQAKNNVIISVQSQKGGVGKTTVALNVAKLLRSEYRVLFFDLDIAGTEAFFAKKAPFWVDCSHVVGFELEEGKDSKTIFSTNLVDMYDYYMSGNTLPTFTWKETEDDISPGQYFDVNRINIISSSIGHTRKGSSVFRNAPQLLFDEAHADWFMEMVRELVQQSCEKQKHDLKPLAVVLDSAPGYSGLGPNIEEWLTDIGPEMAKFIFVASADAQDIAASTFAVQRIQHMFDLKLDVSRFLAKIEKGGNNDFNNEIISDEDRKRFMIRLLDAGRIIKKVQKTGTSDNETNVEKQANPNERIELRPLLWYVRGVHAGFEFNISFSKLVWSVLFNRIPKLLKDDEYQTVLEALFPKIAADDSDDLETIQGQVKLCFDQNSVVYNDKYALQFLLPMFFEKSMALPKRSKSKMPAWSDEQLSETTKDCNFESGEMLLEFLRETHECFQYHAKILEKPTGSRISINWLEFSPLWLFAQQKKTGTWHKELEELSNIPGNIEMGDQLREIYNRRLEQYRGERLADDCLTWIEEAYLAAITLKEWLTMGHLDFNMRKTEIDIRNLKWLRTVLTFSKAVEIGSTDNWPRKKISFNETIFKEECYGEVPLSNNIRILREIFYNQAVFYRAKNVFLKFIQSYNYLLRTADSLRLINATAKYSYVEQYNNLYQVFAESLFHHVLHVRDVSLDEASGYLRIAGEQAQDSETMVKMFFEFKAMNEMVGVVENIIGKNGWGLVDKIGGLDDI